MLDLNSEISTFLVVLNIPIRHTSVSGRVSFCSRSFLLVLAGNLKINGHFSPDIS